MKTLKRIIKNVIAILFAVLFLATSIAAKAQNPSYSHEELAFMPATQLIELYKQGVVSPVDVVNAQKAQWVKTNGTINATTFVHFDDALKLAKVSEKRYQKGTNRALEGITVGVKDEHHDKNWVVTFGSNVHKHDPGAEDADPIVAKLKEAGAIPMIQTTVPELYLNFVTSTKAWGTTRNPWNNEYAVGGSSGGSGAALAAGYCTIATGSDMGGSIRIPAAFNGVYGYKTTPGELHTGNPHSYFAASGPMARNFTDMTLMHNVIAGPGKYSTNVFKHQPLATEYENLEGVKIAYVGGMGIVEPTQEVEDAMQDAIKTLREAGAQVDVVKLNIGLTPDEIAHTISSLAIAGPMGGGFSAYEESIPEMTTYGGHFIAKSLKGEYTNKDLLQAELKVKEMYKNIVDQVYEKGYDIILTPTMPTSHIPADYDFTQGNLTVDGTEYPAFIGMQYTLPFNFLNWMPIVNAPAGISSEGMPIGMQIIGKPYETESVFKVAFNYNKLGIKLFQGKDMPVTK
ncbi:amidase [Algibacter mikhailovii]|uniref:Amidase n=1 Tax=Algibacter mikhailovii TaxID=425498 RepID=A0A918V5S9_9FLAO|nr:amidase [Algibacter mikhailovii]GGZ71855.1 amidase [Algibacter mikhailovii]